MAVAFTAGTPPIAFERAGDPGAEPLILIQGLDMQAIDWPAALIAGLARRFAVIVPENRDSGRSGLCGPAVEPAAAAIAPRLFTDGAVAQASYSLHHMAGDIVALMDALGLPRARLVGFSMGGMIAQIVAATHPERVSGLVSLMSSGGEAWIECDDDIAAALVRSMVARDPAEVAADAVRAARLYGRRARRLPAEALSDHAAAAIARAYRPGGTLRQALAMRSTGPRAALLARIAAPTLVIHGSLDRCIPLAQGRMAAALIPRAWLEIVEDAGHDVADIDSSRLVALIAATG